jgi:LmbE family N-acetylglucosaminyl deacetylase
VTGRVRIAQALTNRTLLVVAAHPDDETVGAGGLLPRMRRATVVTVTDGSPRNPMDAERAGCSCREEYARLRRQELLSSLAVAGIPPERTRALNLVDQEASLEMAYLTMHLLDLLKQLRPTAILTHAYEGGHPDHDATAFAVHAACARVQAPPVVFEFASYHAASHHEPVLNVGQFLPDREEIDTLQLSADARDRKRRMIECFPSQMHMLQHWPLDVERYREAPVYDFTRPPHEGALYYEHFDWGVTGERWRLLAGEALRTLGAATAAS